MASVEFSDAKFRQLQEQASAAGYGDVAAFLEALAEDAAFDARCGMTDEQLAESATECDAELRKLKTEGGAKDAADAMLELGKEFGFKPSP